MTFLRRSAPWLQFSFVALAIALAAPARADLAEAAQRLVRDGSNPTIAQRAARHVLLGMPSEANRKDMKNLLLVRNGYVISYNGDPKRNALNWASWSTSKSDLGNLGRSDNFRPDPTLPKGLYEPSNNDFRIPGYSRGHMVRSGERTANARENSKTFVFTNMLPQSVNNNTGPWNAFENYYRDAVQNNNQVAYVMAGGVWGRAPAAQRGVAIPSATWKIVALLKPGQTPEQMDANTRVMAVIVPNNNTDVKVEQNWDRYRVSVNDIEKQTGLKFFDQVPAALAQTLKSRVDSQNIPPPSPQHGFTPHNWAPGRR